MARGSVGKTGDTWWIRYSAGVDPKTGKRLQPYKRGYTTRAEAEAALAQKMADVAAGRHVSPRRHTFADAAQLWIDSLDVRATSYERFESEVRLHLIPALGRHKLQDLTQAHIRSAQKTWTAAKLSPTYVRTLYGRCYRILGLAVTERLIGSNPLTNSVAPKFHALKMVIWTPAELTTFLAMVPDLGIRGPLWRTYAMTGARRGELLGLLWRDVDFKEGTIMIRQQAIREQGAVQLRECKTAQSVRTVPLDAGTIAALRTQRSTVASAKLAASTWHEHDLVFPRLVSEPLSHDEPGDPQIPDAISFKWTRLMNKLALPNLRLHDLRHTHATHLLTAGTPVHIVAARLGHSPATLLQTYAHSIPADQAAVVTWLNSAYKQG